MSDGGEAGVSSDLRAASVTEVSAYLPERVGAGKSHWLNRSCFSFTPCRAGMHYCLQARLLFLCVSPSVIVAQSAPADSCCALRQVFAWLGSLWEDFVNTTVLKLSQDTDTNFTGL